MGTLTVRENLMFSANLRLPESISIEEKAKRVDEVWCMIKSVWTRFQVSNPVNILGTGYRRARTWESCWSESGGRNDSRRLRRRKEARQHRNGVDNLTEVHPDSFLSVIFVSLLRGVCSILFLDEPTTGLDASTSMNVLRILKRLSLVNSPHSMLHAPALESLASRWAERTHDCPLDPPAASQDLRCVVPSACAACAHPDSEPLAAELFDSVTLLTDGHIVHHGAPPKPPRHIVEYRAAMAR
jgi:hypothetical protein